MSRQQISIHSKNILTPQLQRTSKESSRKKTTTQMINGKSQMISKEHGSVTTTARTHVIS